MYLLSREVVKVYNYILRLGNSCPGKTIPGAFCQGSYSFYSRYVLAGVSVPASSSSRSLTKMLTGDILWIWIIQYPHSTDGTVECVNENPG